MLLLLLAPDRVLSQAPGTKRWCRLMPGTVLSSPAIADDGTIYVGVGGMSSGPYPNGGWLCSFTPQGQTNWMLPFQQSVCSSPAIGLDGTVYVGCWDGKLRMVSPGGVATAVKLGPIIPASPAIGVDGTVYVGAVSNQFNKLFALTSDGTIKWAFDLGPVPLSLASQQFSSPAVGPDGTIYVGSVDGHLYAINPNGTTNWAFPLISTNSSSASQTYASPAIGADGTIYIGADNGMFYALDPSGRCKWSFSTGHIIESSAAVSSDGTVWVGAVQDKVYGFTPEGAQKWLFPIDSVSASPALGADGTVYVGTYNFSSPRLYALSSFGTNLWSLAVDYSIFSSPAIAPDGTIYFGSDKLLYAVNGSGPLMNSPWPMFRGNLKHAARSIQRRIQTPARLGDGNFALDVTVEVGRTYNVDYSADLVHWSELAGFVSSTFTNTFVDLTATNDPGRFYRLRTGLP